MNYLSVSLHSECVSERCLLKKFESSVGVFKTLIKENGEKCACWKRRWRINLDKCNIHAFQHILKNMFSCFDLALRAVVTFSLNKHFHHACIRVIFIWQLLSCLTYLRFCDDLSPKVRRKLYKVASRLLCKKC